MTSIEELNDNGVLKSSFDADIISPEPSESEDIMFDFDNLFESTDENSTIFRIDENKINEERLYYLEQKISPLFISLIKSDEFEFGRKNETIRLVEEQLKLNSIATQIWFNKLYIKYFVCDEVVLIGLLKVIESLNSDALNPTARIMAIAALSHSNDEIKELGVRIFENWGTIDSYEILKKIKVQTGWLQQYINQVIKDIELELCLS